MASTHTGIEWTDRTWNPTTGCDKVSAGCLHCYAEAITERFPQNFPDGFKFKQHPERLNEPKKWRTPSRIFVNSMSDLFHESVEFDFLRQVFEVMQQTPQHIYQILTKRHKRLLELTPDLPRLDNVWLGVSVESQPYVERVDYLRQVDCAVRFLSCEPLLGSLTLNLERINWVIVGGESGFGYRPIQAEWVRQIQQQCLNAEVPFFFKQWGGTHSKSGGRVLDGEIWNQMPLAWEQHLATHQALLLKKTKSTRIKQQSTLITL